MTSAPPAPTRSAAAHSRARVRSPARKSGDAQELVGRHERGEAEGAAPEEPERPARADDELRLRRRGALRLAARAAEGVGIVARDARVGEASPHRVLDALHAPAERRQAPAAAARARARERP